MTNNIVETYALFQQIKQLVKMNILGIIVIGVSLLIISRIISKTLPRDLNISEIVKRIINPLNLIPRFQFYHVLRKNNTNFDEMDNKETHLLKGDLDWQGQLINDPLP